MEQRNLEDVVLVFHEPDCPGLITSNEEGNLHCAECGRQVGQIEPAVLAQWLDCYAALSARPSK